MNPSPGSPSGRPRRARKPPWLRVRISNDPATGEIRSLVRRLRLHTVCEEAACPNLGECWAQRHATFMILGSVCTRACAFCKVETGTPGRVDPDEPQRVARAVTELSLRHVVITSVDRDDLPDGGASHFVRCVEEIRAAGGATTVEVLTPDFRRKAGALESVVAARPDVYNHNLETVPRLYRTVRPGADYQHSVRLLARVKELDASRFTKSGIMLGLGEKRREVLALMDDLRGAGVDFLTMGQYLRPSPLHMAVDRYVSPPEFDSYREIGEAKGFLLVASSPLTRSSHHAGREFEKLRQARSRATLAATS